MLVGRGTFVRFGSERFRVRPTNANSGLATIIVDPSGATPTLDGVQHCVRSAQAMGFTHAVTCALRWSDAQGFVSFGAEVRDDLIVLGLDLTVPRRSGPGEAPPAPDSPSFPAVETAPIRPWELQQAIDIDQLAFPERWQLDRDGLIEAYKATARKRARFVNHQGSPVGYAVTGLSAADGYLQRLAVVPSSQRTGFGRLLVRDSVEWCRSKGATRLVVNTQVDNAVALSLYYSAGFIAEDERMVVLEVPMGSTAGPSHLTKSWPTPRPT